MFFLVMYSVCFLYQFTERECGSYQGVESCYVVKECKRDIKNHLLSYHLSGAKEIEEYDLILARAGHFNLTKSQLDQLKICPKHREELGRGWKRSKTSCQHPAHSARKKTAVKGRAVVTMTICQELHRLYGVNVPPGSRTYKLFYKCYFS